MKTLLFKTALFLFFHGLTYAGDYGIWIEKAPLPTTRQEMPAAYLNGKIYVTGGITDNFFDAITKTNEAFDPLTNTWSTKAPLPISLHHHSNAVFNGKLYVFGGYETIAFSALDYVYEYDPVADEWTSKQPMPFKSGASTAVTFGDYIYVIGGVDGALLDKNLRYDPVTDDWTEMTPMPTAREHLAAAVIDSLIFVVAGRNCAECDVKLEAYSPATDTWYDLPDMPTGRSGLAAAALNGKLYVFGGEGGGTFEEVEEYDPKTGLWKSKAPMPTPRHGMGAVVVGDTIYIPGGAIQEGFGPTNKHEAFVIQTSTAIFEKDNLQSTKYLDYQIYHNYSHILFSLNIKNQSKIQLNIFDSKGRMIESIAEYHYPAEEINMIWNHSNKYPKGVYFFVIQSNDLIYSNKLYLY